jgi:hypothetical protein
MSASSGYGTGGSTPVGPVVETLTGNTGGPVGPTGNNINILGASGVLVAGNPGTSTLTITFPGAATLYTEDVGTAAPSGGNLNIFSGATSVFNNINTFGSGDTVQVRLNDSISLPNTNASGTTGLYSLGGTRFMFDYGGNNTFLGQGSGNLTLTPGNASSNVGIGTGALQSLVGTAFNDGAGNSALGNGTFESITDGSFNTGLGSNGYALTTGMGNLFAGFRAGEHLINGNTNILLGSDDNLGPTSPGVNYVGGESSNIVIGNAPGVTSENNTMRLGLDGAGAGEQNATYIAGIYNRSFGSPSGVVQIDSTFKLGSSAGTNGQILIGSTGASPAWSTITAGANIAIVNAANSITISATGSGGGGAVDFPCDTGTAVESGGILNVFSQAFSSFNNMSTAGSGNTVFVRLKDSISLPATNSSATTGVLSIGGNSFVQGLGSNNTFIGNAGNLTLNTGSATEDTALGSNALHSITTGAENTAIGGFSANLITTGSTNTALGFSALDELTIGSGNIALGVLAGSDYTSSESNNITIGNLGTLGESGVIRIGRSPTHTAAYMAGVYNASIGTTNAPVFIDNTGKLGTLESGVPLDGSSFMAVVFQFEPLPTVSGDHTEFVGTYQAMTVLYDDFGIFNPGPSVGGASFTAPITGRYNFVWSSLLSALNPTTIDNGQIYINGVNTFQAQGVQTSGTIQKGAVVVDCNVNLTAGDVITFAIEFFASTLNPFRIVGGQPGTSFGPYNSWVSGTLLKTA